MREILLASLMLTAACSGPPAESPPTSTNRVEVLGPQGEPGIAVAVVVHDASGAEVWNYLTGSDGAVAVKVPVGGSGDALKALDNDAWKVVGNQVCGLNRSL